MGYDLPMPRELIRYHHTGHFHFVTFSCFHRQPFLATPASRDLFERSLETMRVRYHFVVAGYVLMPEHVHLLLSESRSCAVQSTSSSEALRFGAVEGASVLAGAILRLQRLHAQQAS